MIRGYAIAGLMLLAGCSGGASEEAAPAPAALVTLATAEPGTLAETVTLYGAVEAGPSGRHALAAPVEAMVVSIEAPVGTEVTPGQLVARLKPSATSRIDLARAQADARTAEQAYARARRLRADGLASDADVETARAAARSTGAARTALTAQHGALALRAPAAGFVQAIAPSPGDIVAAGANVATITGFGDVRARFGIDPAIARQLRPGQTIRITPSGGETFAVPIASVDPVVDPATRLASVFARIAGHSGLAMGQVLTGEVAIMSGGAALVIPYAALLDDGGQPYLFVVSNGAAHRRDVTIGATSGARVAVLKGLVRGERVVTQGGTAIEDGMKVRTR